MSKALTKRNQQIVNQILEHKKSLEEIGKRYKITKQRVAQIGRAASIDRMQLIKARSVRALATLKIAYNELKSLNEVSDSLNLSKSCLSQIYVKGTGVPYQTATKTRRNTLITEKFLAGQTASAILIDDSKTLEVPSRVNNVNSVYIINRKNNVKRYPNIGDRSKGGSFLPKSILKFIATEYMKLKSCEEIAEMLNKKKMKTTLCVPFTAGNIFSYVNKMRVGKIII
jgi:predicted DNA-binding protein YlxM (UPF0122 family)